MTNLGMTGPYKMDAATISSQVTRTSAGNYALGHIVVNEDNGDKTFIVQYVGRSDDNVNGRLKRHLGEGYESFKYSYATSPKAAFEKECQNYHDFGEDKKLDNKIHPDKPSDSKDWECPVCEYLHNTKKLMANTKGVGKLFIKIKSFPPN